MQLDADWLLSCFVRKSDQSDSSLQYLKLSVALAINFLLPVPAFDINWKNRYSSLASSLLVTRLSLEAQIINNTQHRELRSSIADSQNCKTPKNSIALGNVTSMPNFSIFISFCCSTPFCCIIFIVLFLLHYSCTPLHFSIFISFYCITSFCCIAAFFLSSSVYSFYIVLLQYYSSTNFVFQNPFQQAWTNGVTSQQLDVIMTSAHVRIRCYL